MSECLEAHATCRSLEQKLRGRKAEADTVAVGERVEWGHEEAGKDFGFSKDLPSMRDKRREILCFRGLDDAPATCLD